MTDGVVQLEILETIGKNEEWLLAELEKEGYDSVQDIFIAEYDKGTFNAVTYEKKRLGKQVQSFFLVKKEKRDLPFLEILLEK